jgi:hypothetical protein
MSEDFDFELLSIDVDELWVREWAGLGTARLERYLAAHAAFAEYLRSRDELEGCREDGDCAPSS